MLRQNSMVGLLALGMTFVILTGGIDLSVGSLLAVAGIVAAALVARRGAASRCSPASASPTLLGLVNGAAHREGAHPAVRRHAGDDDRGARRRARLHGEESCRVDASAQG